MPNRNMKMEVIAPSSNDKASHRTISIVRVAHSERIFLLKNMKRRRSRTTIVLL